MKFGVLFNDDRCANIFEALVGTLRAAKRKKIVSYQGELLLQGVHDDVEVVLLQGWGQSWGPDGLGAAVGHTELLPNTELLSLSFYCQFPSLMYSKAQYLNSNITTEMIRSNSTQYGPSRHVCLWFHLISLCQAESHEGVSEYFRLIRGWLMAT